MGFPLPCDAAASTYCTSQPGVPVPPTSKTTRSNPSCRPIRMSLTVTEAPAEASAVSASRSAGNAGAALVLSSAVGALEEELGDAAVVEADDVSPAEPSPQPANTAGAASRVISRRATGRGRVLTPLSLAVHGPPPGLRHGACIVSSAPGELRAPI